MLASFTARVCFFFKELSAIQELLHGRVSLRTLSTGTLLGMWKVLPKHLARVIKVVEPTGKGLQVWGVRLSAPATGAARGAQARWDRLLCSESRSNVVWPECSGHEARPRRRVASRL